MTIILLFACEITSNTSKEIELNGLWRFKIGDSLIWSQGDFKDSTWSLIPFNRSFDQLGYSEYDGYAWYRYKVFIPSSLKDDKKIKKLEFNFGMIDDCDEFYLNGHLVGANDDIMIHRKYEVSVNDKSILWGKDNTLAIRVLDKGGNGGMISYPYINFSEWDLIHPTPISDRWKFMAGDSSIYSDVNFDDSNWVTIHSGANWESQGFEHYDGIAWYRTEIEVPNALRNATSKTNGKIKICLGQIDDNDQVFLNGALIGENNKNIGLNSTAEEQFNTHPTLVNTNRVYELSFEDRRINWGHKNTIAVRVFDGGGTGGLHKGHSYITTATLQDDIEVDKSKLYRVNASNMLDTIITIHNRSKAGFKGYIRYKGIIHNKKVIMDKHEAITINPEDSAVVGLSLPYSTDEVVLTLGIDDIYSTNIYKDKTKLPFVLFK